MVDPIVEEIRRVRQIHAKQFNYDLAAIVADLKRKENQHPERLVSFPPKRKEPPSEPRRQTDNR